MLTHLLPARLRPGSLHPLTIVEDEIVDVFARMGYRVVEGPEVEVTVVLPRREYPLLLQWGDRCSGW